MSEPVRPPIDTNSEESSGEPPASDGSPPTSGRAAPPKAFNPFYFLLVVAGVVFAVTASAYGVMSVQKLRDPLVSHPLFDLLDQSGGKIFGYEIGALAVATFAAMATDSFWARRAARKSRGKAVESKAPEG